MDTAHFRTFAGYNAWANRRLYDACAALPVEEYQRPRASFFGSIHATLNHILVGDRLWNGRLTGNLAIGITALNQILYPDLATLRAAREAEDKGLIAFLEGRDDAWLEGMLDYRNMAGETRQDPLRIVMAHIFNHQTHHRGQVHGLLSQTAVPPPPLDLIYFTRES